MNGVCRHPRWLRLRHEIPRVIIARISCAACGLSTLDPPSSSSINGAYILNSMTQEEDRIKTIAGYLLKNNSRLILSSPPEAARFLAMLLWYSLVVSNWPECLQLLVGALDSTDLDKQEAAFNALEKACEDYSRKMDVEIGDTRPLDYMIPKFLSLTEHPSTKMRSHAVTCLSYFVSINYQSLFVHIDSSLACLFKFASDHDSSSADMYAKP
ncbi:hypothetical protein C0989_000202 [Termitomyces sp. Mn162]|nr:hypothetical protein C0989_000202 [Termitomyces sp. Mn162]